MDRRQFLKAFGALGVSTAAAGTALELAYARPVWTPEHRLILLHEFAFVRSVDILGEELESRIAAFSIRRGNAALLELWFNPNGRIASWYPGLNSAVVLTKEHPIDVYSNFDGAGRIVVQTNSGIQAYDFPMSRTQPVDYKALPPPVSLYRP